MTVAILLSALEPPQREAILLVACSSSDFTDMLRYSATKQDAARKISQNERMRAQIELTINYNEPF